MHLTEIIWTGVIRPKFVFGNTWPLGRREEGEAVKRVPKRVVDGKGTDGRVGIAWRERESAKKSWLDGSQTPV